MDWPVIIGLALGLPMMGFLIGTLMVWRRYQEIKESPWEFGLKDEEQPRKSFGKFIILLCLFQTGVIYGLLIVTLFWLSLSEMEIQNGTLSGFGIAIALAIGMPVLFSNISRGLVLRDGIVSIVKDPRSYGKTLVLGVMNDPPMIYGLLIAILMLNLSGILEYEFELTCHQVNGLFGAIVLFSCLSSGILLSGILFQKVENPFSTENFSKGVTACLPGHFPPIIGLSYVMYKLVELGIL